MAGFEEIAQIAAQGARFAEEDCENSVLGGLIDAGIVREDGYLEETVCTACDEPHPARVLSEADGAWVLCRQLGKVEVRQAHVRAYSFDHDEIARQLACALDCEKDRSRVLLDEELWMVGRTSLSEKATLTALYAPSLLDLGAHTRIEAKISSLPFSDCGLVVVGSAVELPSARQNWCYARLHEIAHFAQSEGLAVDRARLDALFPHLTRRSAGRPRKHDLNKIFEAIRVADDKTGGDAGATEARREFAKRFPTEPLPSRPTFIRALEKERSS